MQEDLVSKLAKFCHKDLLAPSSSIGVLVASTLYLQGFTYKTNATTYENIFTIIMTNAKGQTFL
jgi:hypothetical protein